MKAFCTRDAYLERVVLFNGDNLGNWTTRDGRPASWRVQDGVLFVVPGTGDIMTRERLTDFFLHLELRCPDMPEAVGHEIQVLDSYGVKIPGKGDCGAIYNQFAPLVNACKPPMVWQSYDVVFRAARLNEEGLLEEPARLTLFQNGVVIHNNVEVLGVTAGALDDQLGQPGPLLLQDHRDLVAYRNIWAVHLPLKGSATYEPR